MAGCFDDVENESLGSCINGELQAGVSEIGVHYAIHEQALEIPMPLNYGEVGYDFESSVTVTEDITFPATKGFSKVVIQSDTGEVKLDLVGNKGNKKPKQTFGFYVPGNSKKLLGFIRTMKNIPMIWLVPERDGQKRQIGDKFNAAYLSEVAGTTGKGGEDDKGVQFTIESYSIPIVYEGVITVNAPSV